MKWSKTLLNLLWRTIKTIGITVVGKDFAKLAKLVAEEVAILEDNGMPGEEKRKAVQRKARAWLKERGEEVSATLLNLLIEIAVAMLTKK